MGGLRQARGKWVSGDSFWNREADITLFTQRIDEGAHQLLVAQRRMGKTSLMQEVKRRLESENRYICLFIDLQKARDAPDAIVELSLATHPYKSLWKKSKDLFSGILSRVSHAVEKVDIGELGVTLRAGLAAGTWMEKGDRLFAILADSDRPVLLLLDEVPILVNRILKGEDYAITAERKSRADEFMSWLRANSIRHQDNVRIVLSGSIGFEPVLHQAGLSSTINNFQPFELKPWDEDVAIGCLEALAEQYGVKLQGHAAAEMIRRLGCCIPHHVQMFFDHVLTWCTRRDRMEFSEEEVDSVYQREMLSTRGHVELTHYEERLKMVLGEEVFTLALDMLSEAAVTGRLSRKALAVLAKEYVFEARSSADVQKDVLWVLEHDGYLEAAPDGYVFVSSLLRDWWKNRYEAFFTPVAQRGA